MFKMKIVLTFLQIITNLAGSVQIQWPPTFKNFVSFFSFANIDFIQASSADCVTNADYYRQLLVFTIVPIVFLILLFCLYLLPKYYCIGRQFQAQANNSFATRTQREIEQDNFNRLSQRKQARRNFWKMLIFTLFLIYPLVSSTIFRIWNCMNVYGQWYLFVDFTIMCYDSTWNSFADYAWVMVWIYPVGIPAFFFFMLYRYYRQDRLDEPGIRAELGFLYASFDRSLWFFELIDMAHKLFLTSFLQLISLDSQLQVGLAVVTVYMMVLLLVKPYKRKGDDKLHLFVQIEIWLFLYCGFLYYENILPSSSAETLLGALLIAICCLIFLYLFIQIIQVLYKKYREKKEKEGKRFTVSDPLELERSAVIVRAKPDRGVKIERTAVFERNPLAAHAVGDESLESNPLFIGSSGLNPLLSPSSSVHPRAAVKSKRPSLMAAPSLEGEDEKLMVTRTISQRGDGDGEVSMNVNPLAARATSSPLHPLGGFGRLDSDRDQSESPLRKGSSPMSPTP